MGFRVEFYSSIAAAVASATLTGDVGSQFVPIGSVTRTNLGFAANASTSHIDMALSITLPAPGTYWFAVMADMPAGAGVNQHGISQWLPGTGGQNAYFVNPGGGWNIPGNFLDSGQDASYRLHSTPIPEPGSMIALGLGAVALVARRRRRRAS